MYEPDHPLYRKTEYFTKLKDKSFYFREKIENEKIEKYGRTNTPFRIRQRTIKREEQNRSDNTIKYTKNDKKIIKTVI